MNDSNEQSTTEFFRFAVCAGLLSLLAVASTVLIADADEPPDSQVEFARTAAERAAAAEGAMRRLDPDGTGEADRQGKQSAELIAGAARSFSPVEVESVPSDWVEAGLDIGEARRMGDKLVQTLPNGGQVELTIDPQVQAHMEKVLADSEVPHGGVTLVEPSTGRVLAMVSHTQGQPSIESIAQKSKAPSASVFKIITAAALIESAGVDPFEDVCYHGGRQFLSETNIKGHAGLDAKCANLKDALAWSINSIMAKLTYQKLDREDLEIWTERFGYNSEIPFELPVEVSNAEIVEEPFERARTAAGFWNTYLSPLHGAMIGAAVANGGVMMRPTLIDKYVGPSGNTLQEFEPRVFRRVMSKPTADTLADLLEGATDFGTARRYFAHNRSFPKQVEVGGKTGTLSNKDPYLGFTWFVGFGRMPSGEAAGVGGLACNTPKWRIKGSYAASEALRKYFEVSAERAREAEVATSAP